MSRPKRDRVGSDLAPAKVHLVAVSTRWSRRRTLLFIIASSTLLWSLIAFGVWLLL